MNHFSISIAFHPMDWELKMSRSNAKDCGRRNIVIGCFSLYYQYWSDEVAKIKVKL